MSSKPHPAPRFLLAACLALSGLVWADSAAAGRAKPAPQRERPEGASRPASADAERTSEAGSRERQRDRNRSSLDSAPATAGDSERLAAARAKIAAPDAAQRESTSELQQDLQAIAGGLKGADEEIRQLGQDLQGMAIRAPDPALVQDLSTDLAAAVGDGDLSPAEVARLADDVYAVLNSAGLSQAELAVIKKDVEAILAASGVGQEEIQAVLRDLQAIYDQLQGG
jgi:hypothetical protein